MTIGIVASGTDAGAAVLDALLAAELFGRGAIGGFAVFAYVDADGDVQYLTTQQGGVSALGLCDECWRAEAAAVISSGPNRPEPLTQFLPASPAVGFVTGHRLPNSMGAEGVPLNCSVLDEIAFGQDPQSAVDRVLQRAAELDAGLIAMDLRGRIGLRNSTRVSRRDDLGVFQCSESGRSLAFMFNSIYGVGDLTQGIADIAWSRLLGMESRDVFVTLSRAVSLEPGSHDVVHINEHNEIERLETANPRLLDMNRRTTVVYLSASVKRADVVLGKAVTELYLNVEAGTVVPSLQRAQNIFVMRTEHD
ncbi:DUF6963 family protein [Comamonas sp. B21-038]|uniref:DUF6963 family protein n=1 Tax=Comamonas sp. B21-038 TaxID=2918299 RepID=UPI001EFAEE0F|nr:hypothetical protein [Comamonas sp. B21-038]ULR89745.1 hypothetical protein MJ205_02290 [Comamonas sp. B21-038]